MSKFMNVVAVSVAVAGVDAGRLRGSANPSPAESDASAFMLKLTRQNKQIFKDEDGNVMKADVPANQSKEKTLDDATDAVKGAFGVDQQFTYDQFDQMFDEFELEQMPQLNQANAGNAQNQGQQQPQEQNQNGANPNEQ